MFRALPALAGQVAWAELGNWPTPLEPIGVEGRPIWIKREGDSHPGYGGNKIRTLEAWLGHARAIDARRIWAIGAYGSNHAVATIVHAQRLGLAAGAIVFPQPFSEWAAENAGALIASGCPVVRLRSFIEVPLAGLAIARRGELVMPPGGATPIGTLGAMSAAFELAEQIAAGIAPPPRRIVLPVGSTCTTAGLLSGLALARVLGVWRWDAPIVHAVRVTPWPVTSRTMIVQLAARTLARVTRLASLGRAAAISARELSAHLVIDGRELGGGYGRPTMRGTSAFVALDVPRAPRIDGVYSAKAAAALLRLHRRGVEPLVFWATKSSALMAPPRDLGRAPRALARWLTSTSRSP